MSETNKVTDPFKSAIQMYVECRAATDPLFEKRVKNPKKNIDDCCKYIIGEVHKSGRQGFHDDEIYGMVVHYYDEEDIEVNEAPACKVVVNTTIELTEEEKEKARQEAVEEFRRQELRKLQSSVKKVKSADKSDDTPKNVEQPSLFD